MEKDGEDFGEMDAAAQKYLSYLTQRLGNAQRVSEILVLELILNGEHNNLKSAFIANFVRHFSSNPSESHLQSCERILTSNFWRTQKEKEDNSDCAVIEIEKDGEWHAADTFVSTLTANPLFSRELKDLTEFIKTRYELTYKGGYGNTLLKLYERYTYEDVCRMLDWSRNITAQNIGGYFYDRSSRTLPVFVNYNKDDHAIAYEDHFSIRKPYGCTHPRPNERSAPATPITSSNAPVKTKTTASTSLSVKTKTMQRPNRSTSWEKLMQKANLNQSRSRGTMHSKSTTDCACRFETTFTPI